MLSCSNRGDSALCGHCFHQEFFQEWEASRGRNHVTKCPMCSNGETAFTCLFLNFEPQDDGDSLSSAVKAVVAPLGSLGLLIRNIAESKATGVVLDVCLSSVL